MAVDFEKAFSDFLNRREYDQAESALFSMVRTAFMAGWRAAGERPAEPRFRCSGWCTCCPADRERNPDVRMTSETIIPRPAGSAGRGICT